MKAFKTLLITESKLSLRGMDMLIFAICMPVIVMVILGIIYGSQPAFEGASYTFIELSFGAVASIPICAGGLMGLPLVISDYRNKKILKRYKVTPISPALILAVQFVIYTLYAIVSLVLVYLCASILFDFQLHGSLLAFLGAYLLVLLSMFSIGLLVGGLSPNVKTAGIVASLLYFSTLIFSGATLPYEAMPVALQKAADFLPMAQGIKLLKAALLNLPVLDSVLPIIVMVVLAVVCIVISIRFFKWE